MTPRDHLTQIRRRLVEIEAAISKVEHLPADSFRYGLTAGPWEVQRLQAKRHGVSIARQIVEDELHNIDNGEAS